MARENGVRHLQAPPALAGGGDCVFVLSADHCITGVNQAALNMLGRHAGELLGKPIAAVLGGPAFRKPGRTALADLWGATEPMDLTLYARDQRPVPVVFHSTVVTGNDGRDTLLCYARPKTAEGYKAWGAVRADMLRQSQDEFLSNMSHEMRTPLTGILGMAQILEESALTTEQREQLQTILDCGQTLMAFIDRVLDFKEARATEGGGARVAFCPGDMVHAVLDRYEASFSAKDLRVTVHFDENVPRTVLGDDSKVRRVLDCLVDNAVKFTEPGGDVGVRLVREAGGGDQMRLRVSVRDTGVGIPPTKQELVFEPFQQADGSTTRRFSGGGLGLSLARELIRALGGEMWVDSDPGWGSEFHLSIPLEVPPGGILDRTLVDGL